MDIYRICSLGKALTETIEEVVRDPTEQLKNKIWRLYDSCLEEEMAKLKDHDATINVSFEMTKNIFFKLINFVWIGFTWNIPADSPWKLK